MNTRDNRARFHRETTLARAMERILVALASRLNLDRPLTAYLAGGMAVHLYTGVRVTTDIDAEFDARIAVPADLVEHVVLEDGTERVLFVDTNFNPMFSLLHERYQEDAIELELPSDQLKLFVLSPLDLAVSKLARFADHDRDDISALAAAGLIGSGALDTRAREALTAFVGGQAMVRANIADAGAMVRSIEQRATT